MKSSITKIVTLVLLFAFVASACSNDRMSSSGGGETNSDSSTSSAPSDSGEKIVIRLAHEDPDDNQWGMGAIHFKELVEEKTNGQVEIDIYSNGQLGDGHENIEQIQTGALEMTLVGSDLVTYDSFFKIFDLPYILENRDHAKKVLADEEILLKCNEALADDGLYLVGMWENGFRQITNNKKPIVVPGDLKGLKIRVPENEVRISMFDLWGANPTVMAFSEVYTSLQQNVIDGQENPYGNIWGDKIFEVQKYISNSNHVFTPINVLISKSLFDGLSTDIQNALIEASAETTQWQIDWAASQEEDWIQDMIDEGCELNEVDYDAFVKESQPIWDSVKDELGDEASELIDRIQSMK